MIMLIIAICITVLSAYSSKLLVTGNQMQYVYPVMPSQAILPEYLQMSKRLTKAEPTCEELRIMWRYSKRQHRAIEITNQVPMFRDPFLYNVWEAPSRSPSPSTFRETVSRPEPSVPIYGKMVHHKDSEERTLRNGMPNRLRLDDTNRLYGTINLTPPATPRRLLKNNRNSAWKYQQLPQTGSFQQLKDFIQNERNARQLQD